VSAVTVVGQPQVRIVVAPPVGAGSWEDSNGPMICAAVEREGGIVGDCVVVERNRPTITAALVEPGADIVLVIGGTGPGSDDHAAAALTEAGRLAIHGLALRPGETTGLGHTAAGVPVKIRFAPDSPLEGEGFELPVPPREGVA
jgi:molybdopterin molybdotransferase